MRSHQSSRSGVSFTSRINPIDSRPEVVLLLRTLVDLIVRVYPHRRIQLEGGPKWIDSERFDVVDKANARDQPMKYADFVPLVQTLLESRFKLTMHRETKPTQVIALIAGTDRPKISASQDGEQTGMRQGERGEMTFQGMSMSGLVNTLSNILHVPVVDRTGLSGSFNFKLDPQSVEQTDGASPRMDSFADPVIKAVEQQRVSASTATGRSKSRLLTTLNDQVRTSLGVRQIPNQFSPRRFSRLLPSREELNWTIKAHGCQRDSCFGGSHRNSPFFRPLQRTRPV